jgi:hypothetical protein
VRDPKALDDLGRRLEGVAQARVGRQHVDEHALVPQLDDAGLLLHDVDRPLRPPDDFFAELAEDDLRHRGTFVTVSTMKEPRNAARRKGESRRWLGP